MNETKKKLLQLQSSGDYLFHGTDNPDIKVFEPRQAFNYINKVGIPDGEPAVFASDKVDYAILMALINKKNCPKGFTSRADWDKGELKLSATKGALKQLDENTAGYVYVFNKSDFSQREDDHTEYRSFKNVEPIEILKVGKEDLSEGIQFIEESKYKLIVHSPLTHSDIIRKALGEVGAGKIGNYDFCSFSYRGTGRFRGNENSNPAIGQKGIIEEVGEEVIEIVMEESILKTAIDKLKAVHPYEEPAYEVYKLENI